MPAEAKTNKRALGIIFLTVFIDLLGFGIVLPLLPLYGVELFQLTDLQGKSIIDDQGKPRIDYAMIGLLMASYSGMQFLFSPIWGRLSDRIGRRPILILGLTGSVVFYFLFGFGSKIGSVALLFSSRIGAGISGATISTAQAYIADSSEPDQRTRGMALIGAAFGLGFIFGPLLAILALYLMPAGSQGLSPMPGYFASGFSAIALTLAIFILPESLKAGSKATGRSWFHLDHFRMALSLPSIGSLIFIFFVTTFSLAMFENTLAVLSKKALKMDLKTIMLMFVYAGFCMAIAQGCVRQLSKRMSDTSLAYLGIVLQSIGLIGVAIVCAKGFLALMVVMMPLLIAGFAFLSTSVQSIISQRTRPDQQGGILGVNQSGSALARILGPLVSLELFGLGMFLPYGFATVLMIVVLLLLLRLPAAPENQE